MTEHDGVETLENARVGYQVAADLQTSEQETLWSKFNTLVLANSIILASIGLCMTASRTSRDLILFSIMLSFVGMVLCFLWFSIMKRGFEYHNYWLFSARELEEQYLSHPVQTFSRGEKFADGKEIKIGIGGITRPLQMSRWSQTRVKRASSIFVGLFFSMYLIASTFNTANIITGSYKSHEKLISILEENMQQKDKQINNLQKQLVDRDKAIEDARQRSDAIILQLTQQLEDQQKP